MNWGKGIIIGMGIFMLFITVLGVAMFRQPDEADPNYYEKGLAFDADYARERQVVKDHAQPSLQVKGNVLAVGFVAPATGTATFMRPSTEGMDKIVKLPINTGEVTIPLTGMAPGHWQLRFDWTSNGRKYLFSREITLP